MSATRLVGALSGPQRGGGGYCSEGPAVGGVDLGLLKTAARSETASKRWDSGQGQALAFGVVAVIESERTFSTQFVPRLSRGGESTP